MVGARGGEESSDHVLLLDDEDNLRSVFSFDLDNLEQVLSCECFSLGMTSTEFLVVGTAYGNYSMILGCHYMHL